MPINKRDYPEDWGRMALKVKCEAKWVCQRCSRPCRLPGEAIADFTQRIEGIPHPDLDWANQTAVAMIAAKPQRFTLTVAHLDQNPQNNSPENLKALCSVCHLGHDRPFRMHNRYRKRERLGQLRLWGI